MARVIYVDRRSFAGPDAVRDAIREAVAIASGSSVTRAGSRDVSTMLAVMGGNAILGEVIDNYSRQSRGLPGDFGPAWTPLLPATVEQRMRRHSRQFGGRSAMADERRRRRERYRALVEAERLRLRASTRPTIPPGTPPAERQEILRLWRQGIERQVAISVGQFPHELHDAKRQGTHPFALALMLRDTGVMFASLTPGYLKAVNGTQKSDHPQQQFESLPGVFAVGTKVPYAKYHMHGTYRGERVRIPPRPFMPTDGSVPTQWLDAATDAVGVGVAGAIRWVLSGGAFDP